MRSDTKLIKRRQVISSHVKSVGWKDKVLQIEYTTGAVYSYSPVSKKVYEELVNSESIGKFLHARIKNNPKINTEKNG